MSTQTVLLTLAGPMQAWSRQVRAANRPTQDHPTKTGVIGLVANALGYDRDQDITELADLAFAIRADRPGTREIDYHTIGSGDFPVLPGTLLADPYLRAAAARLPDGVSPADPDEFPAFAYSVPGRAVTTHRTGQPIADWASRRRNGHATAAITVDEYLADAVFTAALTGPAPLVRQIAGALQIPARILSLGRRSYLPTGPVLAAVTDDHNPVDALATHPRHPRAAAGALRVWADAQPDDRTALLVDDQPASFSATNRRATGRLETTQWVNPQQQPPAADTPAAHPPPAPGPIDPALHTWWTT